MLPRIKSKQLITITPVDPSTLEKGDIVFCKVHGSYLTHLLSAIQGDRYQISNNHGHVNGWIGANGIFGKVSLKKLMKLDFGDTALVVEQLDNIYYHLHRVFLNSEAGCSQLLELLEYQGADLSPKD